MRPPLVILLLATLAAPLARAGAIVVDPVQRRIETSKLVVRFDQNYADMVRDVIFKDWGTADLAADDAWATEFWGQTARGISSPGYLQPLRTPRPSRPTSPASASRPRTRRCAGARPRGS